MKKKPEPSQTKKSKRKEAVKEKTAPKSPRPKEKPLHILESTQMWSPILDIKDGIILTKDGRYVQILEFSPINFQLLSDMERVMIANTFGGAVSTYPNHFQIKILSRRANVDMHIQDIRNAQKVETNELCRKMQDMTIQKILGAASSSVTRRFFIIFSYENSRGALYRPSWEEIRSDMATTAFQIYAPLSGDPCNNELLTPMNPPEALSDVQLEVLYECMCRKEAESKPIFGKVLDVVTHYAAAGRLENGKIIPINNFIAPSSIIHSSASYIIVDGKYYAFGCIDGGSYPTERLAGWVSQLIGRDEGIDLDIFVDKIPSQEVRRRLYLSMRANASTMFTRNATSADSESLENKMASAMYIKRELENRQVLCNFHILITAIADSPEALKRKMRTIKSDLSAYSGLNFIPLTFRHDQAFLLSLPLCSPDRKLLKKARRNILNGDFSSAYPFTSYEQNDPHGILLGINIRNNSPVFVDFFDRSIYASGNAVLIGYSGVGKTYSLQTIALAMRQRGVRTIIITPDKGHEYRRACLAVGGEFVSIAPGSPQNINIMAIRKYKNVKDELFGSNEGDISILSKKISQIHAFISILKPDISPQEKQALDDALLATYKKYGITLGNKSLVDPQNPSQYKPMPTLGDLYQELTHFKGGAGIREALALFVEGSARSFNAPTNVNLDNPYIVLDVSNTPKKMIPAIMFIANDLAVDKLREDITEQKVLIIDELSQMIGVSSSTEAASSVLQHYKTLRAFNTVVITATQDTNDFFALENGVYGRGILANAKIKIILRQEKEEARTIAQMIGLSQQEEARLTTYNRGDALLVANRNHAEIHIVASALEDALINTDPTVLQNNLQQ